MLGKIARATLVNVLSIGGLLKLYTSYAWDGKEHPIATVVTILVFLLIASLYIEDLVKIVKGNNKSFKPDSKKIVAYMRKWVSRSGRTTIFSRDMTWANDPETKRVLCEKARGGDLTVLLEVENKLSADLKEAGAKIVTYGALGHVPKSRFTIVGFERGGSRVAIGALIDGRHVIEEFQSGQHPLFDVTEDLVQFLIKADKARA